MQQDHLRVSRLAAASAAALLLLACLTQPAARAADPSWTNSVSEFRADSASGSPGVDPSNHPNVSIANAGSKIVMIDAVMPAVNTDRLSRIEPPSTASVPLTDAAKPAEATPTSVPGTVCIVGRVRMQGEQPLPPGQKCMVCHAILKAGGFSSFANGHKVQVIRKNADGKTERITVDVASIMKSSDSASDIELQPGDMVMVPESMWNF